ncbi:MAG: glycosyltransferase family 1 protein [Cryomorphaceae bacterium]|nr:MAG: glycosyltransferase family 1 protein [Cryomorphaceae bacterium]
MATPLCLFLRKYSTFGLPLSPASTLVIAVNTRLLLPNRLEGIGRFSFETLQRMVHAHPEHQFVYVFDRDWDEQFITANNITPVAVSPQARHPLLWRIWLDYSVPRAIKRFKPDLFLSPDGFLSQRLTIPQVPVIHDLNFEHYPGDLRASHSRYYRKYMPRFASIAKRIATVSEFSKNDLVQQYGVDSHKIDVVYNGVSAQFNPTDKNKINSFKEQFTNGQPYFLFVGSMHPRKNIQRLLQAFDLARKKILKPHKLVLAGEKYWWNDDIKQSYEQMEFRDDVVFTGRISNELLVMALSGATALTFVPYFEGFGIPILEAFATGCPVITSNITAMPEVSGEAALLVNPFSEEVIAEAMARMAQEPQLALSLATKGAERVGQFTWERTANALWKTIERSLG